ncbi:MAG: ATP-binding protein [Thermodesulfobacteriota bacterium]
MNDSEKTITLRIESRWECVSLVGVALRGICFEHTQDADTASCIELAVCEAINNIIEHGYGEESGDAIVIEVHLGSGRIDIRTKDTGKSFSPDSAESRVAAPPCDCSQISLRGRGLHIITSIMDTWSYEAQTDGTNVLQLTKYLRSTV